MKIKAAIYSIFLVLFGFFMIQNVQNVDVNFLWWQLTLPRAFLLLLTFLLGVGLGILLPFSGGLKKSS